MKSKPENRKSHKQNPIYATYKKMADEVIALKIFEIIEQDPHTSQQKITMQTGLTAGLVHSFMKRIINKGWVRAKKVNAKRWLYFMTLEGFVEKSRLTMGYLSRTLNAYRSAQQIVNAHLQNCIENNWQRLVVVGENELAEIAVLNIRASNEFYLVGVVATEERGVKVAGEPALPFSALNDLNYHKLLICDFSFIAWNMQNGERVAKTKMLSIMPTDIEFT